MDAKLVDADTSDEQMPERLIEPLFDTITLVPRHSLTSTKASKEDLRSGCRVHYRFQSLTMSSTSMRDDRIEATAKADAASVHHKSPVCCQRTNDPTASKNQSGAA